MRSLNSALISCASATDRFKQVLRAQIARALCCIAKSVFTERCSANSRMRCPRYPGDTGEGAAFAADELSPPDRRSAAGDRPVLEPAPHGKAQILAKHRAADYSAALSPPSIKMRSIATAFLYPSCSESIPSESNSRSVSPMTVSSLWFFIWARFELLTEL